MRDASAALGDALGGELQKLIGCGPLPARIARRKVLADVAIGERTEDRVDQRMQPDVGIRVAGQRAVVRDADAAQDDVIAVAEGMQAGARVDAAPLEGAGAACSRLTTSDGRVALPLEGARRWLVTAVHMRPAPAGSDADWESFWASLTFELAEGARGG